MTKADKRLLFLKICFWIGAVADLLATVPLLVPEAAKAMFGLPAVITAGESLYASRIGASLMLGWTVLLVWGSRKPVARKEILLFTLAPVLIGLLMASVLVVQSGAIQVAYILPLWIFYAVLIPLYALGYWVAIGLEKDLRGLAERSGEPRRSDIL